MEQRAGRDVCAVCCLTRAAANSGGLQAAVPRVPSPRVQGACPLCGALYSRQRYAARPSLLCRSPLVLLQAAAAARIAGKHGIVAAARSGDVADVMSYSIAHANCVNQYNGW